MSDSNELLDSNKLRDALRVAVPVEPEEKVALRREALLATIESEIQATPKRLEREQSRFRWRRGVRVAAVAAALVATLGLGMLVAEFEGNSAKLAERTASVRSAIQAKASPKSVDARLSLAGRSFETAAGHEKVLHLAGDTKVTLAAHTKVLVRRDSANEQYLSLTSGGLLLSVPPNRKDRSVQVQTTHATVQVTGTVFGVEVGRFSGTAAAPLRTRVTVERGQVVVLHRAGRVVLESGDTWLSEDTSLSERGTLPRGAAVSERAALEAGSAGPVDSAGASTSSSQKSVSRASAPAESSPPSSKSGAAHPLAPERARLLPSDTPDVVEPSTLAAQNNLLEKALSAETRGNYEHASELVDRFLLRYPRSPLKASALAIRKRLDLAH